MAIARALITDPDAHRRRRADRRPRPHDGGGGPGPARAAQRRTRQDDHHGHARPQGRQPRAQDRAAGKGRAGRLTPGQRPRDVRPVFLVLKNAFRHKLRTTLTIVGIVVAITAFGLLRTIVDAWYAGAEATSSARLVTRNAISLVFPLPLNYAQKIRQVPGVAAVSWANWFGGVYITESNFFPQFAIDAPTYLDMYPEFVLKPEEKKAFLVDRKGAVVGRKLADQYGWKIGDQIPLRGTIFSGHVDVHAARDLRRRRRQGRRDAVLLPLAVPERDGQGALPAPRRPDRRLHRRDPRSRRRPRRFRRRSTRRSRTRSPRR